MKILLVLSLTVAILWYIPEFVYSSTLNLTHMGLGVTDFPTIDDMNEINDIKEHGSQATREALIFIRNIDSVAQACADKMNVDTNLSEGQKNITKICSDFAVDYANTLRTFLLEHQNQTNIILYGQPISN